MGHSTDRTDSKAASLSAPESRRGVAAYGGGFPHEGGPMRPIDFPRRPFAYTSRSLLVAAALAACASTPSFASSHREAPFIATQPQVDGADFYLFRSYEPGRDGYVVFVRLPAAAGRVRRAQLFQARSERALRDPCQQRWRRGRQPDLFVPRAKHPRRQHNFRRRQDGVDPARAKRLG